MDEIDLSSWPMCSVEGCPNRCCLRLNSARCYPHTLLGPGADPYLLTNPSRIYFSEVMDPTNFNPKS